MNWYELSQIWGSLTTQQKMAYLQPYFNQQVQNNPLDFNRDGRISVGDMTLIGQGRDVFTPQPTNPINPNTGQPYPTSGRDVIMPSPPTVSQPTGGTYMPKPITKPTNPWMAPYPTQPKPSNPGVPTPRNPNLPMNKPVRAWANWTPSWKR